MTLVITDFEMAIINAIRAEFPNASLGGCYFHFAQCLWKAVMRLGLAADYQNDHRLKYVVRKTMALGFIPLAFVRNCYNVMLAHPLTVLMLQVFPHLQAFLTYFEDNWMDANGSYPPAMWNVHTRPMEFRTNNSVESYHNRYEKIALSFWFR